MTSTTNPNAAKLAKASKERVRKASAKSQELAAASADTTIVHTWTYDADADSFAVVSIDGPSYEPIVVASGLSADDAKNGAKNPAALADEPSGDEPTGDAEPTGDGESEQPATRPEPSRPESESEFTPRNVYLACFDLFAASSGDIAHEFGVETKVARRALKKLESRGLVTKEDVNESGQGDGRRGQFGSVVFQCAPGTYDSITRDEAAKAYDDLEAAENEAKATRRATGSDQPRSQGRKLVAQVGGSEVIIRMSERQQAQCIKATGSLPKIGDVEFVRADGTPKDAIVASAPSGDDDAE